MFKTYAILLLMYSPNGELVESSVIDHGFKTHAECVSALVENESLYRRLVVKERDSYGLGKDTSLYAFCAPDRFPLAHAKA